MQRKNKSFTLPTLRASAIGLAGIAGTVGVGYYLKHNTLRSRSLINLDLGSGDGYREPFYRRLSDDDYILYKQASLNNDQPLENYTPSEINEIMGRQRAENLFNQQKRDLIDRFR